MDELKNLKCPSCEALWPMLVLGMGHEWNGNVVDDASLEVMLRIERTMQRLAVMGGDDCRYLWITIEAPKPINGNDEGWEEEPDSEGRLWYELMTAHCRDFHYLILSNRCWRFVDLRSSHQIDEPRDMSETQLDLTQPLLRLEQYVTALVDAIVHDPDAYNDYVERHLPLNKRDGVILRSDLYDICPMFRNIDQPQACIRLIEEMKALTPRHFSRMTLRLYMHYWRLAYVAYRTMDDFQPDEPREYEGLDDMEVFQYSSKGREVKDLDLDAEDDFLRWEWENASYHCHDVAYARIHLMPWRDKTGGWHLALSYNVAGYFKDVLHIVEAFLSQGVGIDIDSFAEAAIKKLKEEDTITITPLPNKYREEMCLPVADDDITQDMVNALVRKTVWKPVVKVALPPAPRTSPPGPFGPHPPAPSP